MRAGELRALLGEVPDYYDVRLNQTVPVEGLEQHASEDGPFVVVI